MPRPGPCQDSPAASLGVSMPGSTGLQHPCRLRCRALGRVAPGVSMPGLTERLRPRAVRAARHLPSGATTWPLSCSSCCEPRRLHARFHRLAAPAPPLLPRSGSCRFWRLCAGSHGATGRPSTTHSTRCKLHAATTCPPSGFMQASASPCQLPQACSPSAAFAAVRWTVPLLRYSLSPCRKTSPSPSSSPRPSARLELVTVFTMASQHTRFAFVLCVHVCRVPPASSAVRVQHRARVLVSSSLLLPVAILASAAQARRSYLPAFSS